MSMPSHIEQLLVLQNRDQKLLRLASEIAAAPATRAALEQHIAQAVANHKALEAGVREAELERARLDGDVKAKEASIAKFKTQQQQTRKNEEYQALAHEIERYQADVSKIEDAELEVMERIDALKEKLAAATLAFRREKAEIEEEKVSLDTRTAALNAQCGDMAAERGKLAADIPEELLGLYGRLFKNKRDAAVVAAEHDVCTGCHMKLTTQTLVKVRGGREIVHCENCGRILYEGN